MGILAHSRTIESALSIEGGVEFARHQFLLCFAPPHDLFGKMLETRSRTVVVRSLTIENSINPVIDLFNFLRAENRRIFQVVPEKLAQNAMVLIEIDVAVSIGFFAQLAYGAN